MELRETILYFFNKKNQILIIFCLSIVLLFSIKLVLNNFTNRDINGDFIYNGLNNELRYYSNPIIDFRNIHFGSVISISQENKEVYVSFRDKNNNNVKNKIIDKKTRKTKLKIKNGEIIYKEKSHLHGKILPGYGKWIQKIIISKTSNGDLKIKTTFGEEALIFYIMPFKETETSKTILPQLK